MRKAETADRVASMLQRKPPGPARKRVWRISKAAPKGEWVDVAKPVIADPGQALPEVTYGSWVTSSYDLLDGADVIEDDKTLPGELLDELFPPKKDSP